MVLVAGSRYDRQQEVAYAATVPAVVVFSAALGSNLMLWAGTSEEGSFRLYPRGRLRPCHQFKSELSIDPDNAQALAYLGDIAMKKNEPDAAVPLLKKALEARNDIRIAHLDLGAILTEQKHYPAAIASLKRAVELHPDQPDAHYRLGRVYQATGKQAGAQKEFAKVRELHEKAEKDVARKMSAAPPPLPQ